MDGVAFFFFLGANSSFPLESTEKEKPALVVKEKEKVIDLPASVWQKSRHCTGTQAKHLQAQTWAKALQPFSQLISESHAKTSCREALQLQSVQLQMQTSYSPQEAQRIIYKSPSTVTSAVIPAHKLVASKCTCSLTVERNPFSVTSAITSVQQLVT